MSPMSAATLCPLSVPCLALRVKDTRERPQVYPPEISTVKWNFTKIKLPLSNLRFKAPFVRTLRITDVSKGSRATARGPEVSSLGS